MNRITACSSVVARSSTPITRHACSLVATVLLLTACGSDKPTTPAPVQTKPADSPAATPAAPAATPAATPPTAVKAETATTPAGVDMDADIKALMAKPELPDEKVELQHILIGFKGAPRLTQTRSKEEAKVLAQKVYAEVMAGGDFLALVKQYTDDSAPGIYPVTKAGRARMAKAFGDVGFRLKVGEIGVAPWDAAASPFGWHIIKRLK